MRRTSVPRESATIYLEKAIQFERAMGAAAARDDWNAVGLLAVHAVISSLDAVTTAYLGARSRSPDHLDVLEMVKTLSLDGVAAAVRQSGRVIGMKNTVAYEARSITRSEADDLRRDARRVIEWSRRWIPSRGREQSGQDE